MSVIHMWLFRWEREGFKLLPTAAMSAAMTAVCVCAGPDICSASQQQQLGPLFNTAEYLSVNNVGPQNKLFSSPLLLSIVVAHYKKTNEGKRVKLHSWWKGSFNLRLTQKCWNISQGYLVTDSNWDQTAQIRSIQLDKGKFSIKQPLIQHSRPFLLFLWRKTK